jgi:hypothetical protein
MQFSHNYDAVVVGLVGQISDQSSPINRTTVMQPLAVSSYIILPFEDEEDRFRLSSLLEKIDY